MAYIDLQPVSRVTPGSIAKYMLLPGILPRLKNLSFILKRILFMFVQIMGAAKLIDASHPCLRPENIGRYNFTEIVLMAWHRLEMTRQNLPKIIMFFSVVMSLLIIMTIIVIGGFYLFAKLGGEAQAQYFSTPTAAPVPYDAHDDWGLQFLERVFGGRQQTGLDFWIENDDSNSPSSPTRGNPWYTALLVGMLRTYSQALIFIALIMILYILVTTLAEAARTGRPFGEKFDSVWAPIRFAIAIGMLLPVTGSGYNGAQLIVFQVAEWGSNLATNMWHEGIDALRDPAPTNSNGERQNFIGASVSDPGYRFVRDMFLINLCVYGYGQLVKDGQIEDINSDISPDPTTASDDKIKTYNFGNEASNDFCGSVVLPQIAVMPASYLGNGRTQANFLPTVLTQNYERAAMLFMPGGKMNEVVTKILENAFCDRNKNLMELECGAGGTAGKCTTEVKKWVYEYWETALGATAHDRNTFFANYNTQLTAYNSWVIDSLREDARFGWAGAGAFYLRMSYTMSVLNDAINTQPRVSKLPTNITRSFATPNDQNISNQAARMKCGSKDNEPICSKYAGAAALWDLLRKGQAFFANAPKNVDADLVDYENFGGYEWDSALKMTDTEESGASDMADILGPIQSFLFSQFKINDNDLHPLGQVINWGNTFMNVSGIAYALSIAMGIVGLFPWGGWALPISMIAQTLGNILIIPGFILMFVIPLMPFLYFTFAVVEWISSIVEAVIGIPLWALTFISAEGDLAGRGLEGVKILFDIMLKPSIIVFSLVSSVLIFTAAVGFFNDSIMLYMDVYMGNAGQELQNGPRHIAGFGMVFVYMFAVYSLATSCFKLIDAMPAQFGRWLGLQAGFGNTDDTKIGPSARDVALASAVVVNEGTSLVGSPFNAGYSRIDSENQARENKQAHDRWREGYTDSKGMYHEGEIARVSRANMEATEHNQGLAEYNKFRAAQGLSQLPMKPYQKLPEAHDLNFFRKKLGQGYNWSNRNALNVKGDFYSMPIKTNPGSNAGTASTPTSNPGPGAPVVNPQQQKNSNMVNNLRGAAGRANKVQQRNTGNSDVDTTNEERIRLRELRDKVKNWGGPAITDEENQDLEILDYLEDRAQKRGDTEDDINNAKPTPKPTARGKSGKGGGKGKGRKGRR